MGKVTAVTTPGSYKTLTVTHISSGGTFADTNDVVVSFVANGSNANQKSGVIKNYSILDDGLSKQGTSYQLMQTFDIPANVFATQYNEVTIKGGFSGTRSKEASVDKFYSFLIEVDGQEIIVPSNFQGSLSNDSTHVSLYANPGGSFEIKLYATDGSRKLRPVILSKNNSLLQDPQLTPDVITTSDVAAGNIREASPTGLFCRNLSLQEIQTTTAFTSALTVNIWMKSSSTSMDSAHPITGLSIVTPTFRVMNLHASYNKV
jgi:hypothetical protein